MIFNIFKLRKKVKEKKEKKSENNFLDDGEKVFVEKRVGFLWRKITIFYEIPRNEIFYKNQKDQSLNSSEDFNKWFRQNIKYWNTDKHSGFQLFKNVYQHPDPKNYKFNIDITSFRKYGGTLK